LPEQELAPTPPSNTNYFNDEGLLFFKPDMAVASRLVKLKHGQHISYACEPVVSDQSLLNHAFAFNWTKIKWLVRQVHYCSYYNKVKASIVHFVGRAKPTEWMTACARNRTAALLGPPRASKVTKKRALPGRAAATELQEEGGSSTTYVKGRPCWAAYLRDKTVVVGAGPSVRVSLGLYIDFARTCSALLAGHTRSLTRADTV
jgi:hypothetical protein